MTILRQLTEQQRLSVIAALVVMTTTGVLLIFFARAAARITRWYMNRPANCWHPPGPIEDDPIEQRPRPQSLDQDHWGSEA